MPDRGPLYPDEILPSERERGRLPRLRSALGMIVDSWRRRGPRRALGVLAVLLLLGGVALFAYPFATDVYASWKQSRLEQEFGREGARRAYLTRTIRPGEALTRITIPRLGVDAIVVEGTSPGALRAGAGHYEGSALPCERGNAAIAGHRTTYAQPFADLHLLRAGDRIILATPVGRCTYRVVVSPWRTHPRDLEVLGHVNGSVLTLTTCDPPGSSAERLIVRARMVESEASIG